MKHFVCLLSMLLLSPTAVRCQEPATLQNADSGSPQVVMMLNSTGYEILNRVNSKEVGFYPDRILGKVRNQWYPKVRQLKKANSLQTGTTLVNLTVQKDGTLGSLTTTQSSGSDVLDVAARDAIAAAAPFAPFPSTLREKELQMRMHFGYAQTPSPEAPVCNGPNLGAHHGELVLRQVGQGVTPPHSTYQPDPEYSDQARRAKYQSFVMVGGTVDPAGDFTDTCIAQAAGEGLDEKAIETVRTWKFEPARQQGEAVPVRIGVEVSFRLY